MGMLLLLAFAYSTPTFGQCLHGPSEEAAQKVRRQAALRLVRAINTAEANQGMSEAKKFLPLEQLVLEVRQVAGFEVQFTTDGSTSYSVLLRDKSDPCGFTFSTNQFGVIFQGYPIDYDVHPVKRD
jgi:hypothetical protein